LDAEWIEVATVLSKTFLLFKGSRLVRCAGIGKGIYGVLLDKKI
jgi:hypothetical protein